MNRPSELHRVDQSPYPARNIDPQSAGRLGCRLPEEIFDILDIGYGQQAAIIEGNAIQCRGELASCTVKQSCANATFHFLNSRRNRRTWDAKLICRAVEAGAFDDTREDAKEIYTVQTP